MTQRNFPNAYRSLLESLQEISAHLQKCGLSAQTLSPSITLKTPQQLAVCVSELQQNVQQIEATNAAPLEKKLTVVLCESFIDDANTFAADLRHEIDAHSVGLAGYLNGYDNV